jgi:hypothetical protein
VDCERCEIKELIFNKCTKLKELKAWNNPLVQVNVPEMLVDDFEFPDHCIVTYKS